MPELGYLCGNGMELVTCRQSTISYPLHNHVSVFTLGFIMDGFIELVTDKGTRTYQKGEAFVLGPYTPHSINARSCYELLSLCIDKELVTQTDLELLELMVSKFLHQAIKHTIIENWILQTLHSLLLFCQMLPIQQETNIDSLREQLELYPEIPYCIEDMAALALTSKYNLIRSFKKEVGLTPHQFQIQNRVRKAQKLLNTSASVAEVALATGFFDQSHFIRCFEKIVGLTPTEYKRAYGTVSSMPAS